MNVEKVIAAAPAADKALGTIRAHAEYVLENTPDDVRGKDGLAKAMADTAADFAALRVALHDDPEPLSDPLPDKVLPIPFGRKLTMRSPSERVDEVVVWIQQLTGGRANRATIRNVLLNLIDAELRAPQVDDAPNVRKAILALDARAKEFVVRWPSFQRELDANKELQLATMLRSVFVEAIFVMAGGMTCARCASALGSQAVAGAWQVSPCESCLARAAEARAAPMTPRSDRLAELERENKTLRARVAALEQESVKP